MNQLIVTCLEEAVPERPPEGKLTREEETRRLRAALGAVDIDVARWKRYLGLPDVTEDHEALRASLPVLDPPLSRTIIEDREDRA